MLCTSYRMCMKMDRSKLTVTLLHTPIKPYIWTPWNSSIFSYINNKNSYPNATLEIVTLYATLSKTFKWNTPLLDAIHSLQTHPSRLLQCRVGYRNKTWHPDMVCTNNRRITWCFSDRASWIDYILITNLMHGLLFIHKILFSSTCFEPQVLIFRRIQLYTCSIW
jgi:hypothetical protein